MSQPICPSLTATFRKVQQQLAEQNVSAQLISISVDPTTDTPERLHEFAAKFKAEPGWTFVTGTSSDIDSILKAFGVAVEKNDHSPMICIGNDQAGYWTRAYGLSAPTSLVKLIALAANRSRNPPEMTRARFQHPVLWTLRTSSETLRSDCARVTQLEIEL